MVGGIGNDLLTKSIEPSEQKHYGEVKLTLQANLGEMHNLCVCNGCEKSIYANRFRGFIHGSICRESLVENL